MDVLAIRSIFDTYQRKIDHDPQSEQIVLDHLTRLVWHEHHAGMVSYSDLTAGNADAAIVAEIDYFRGLNYSFEWKLFSYDTPNDLAKRLSAHGLIQSEEEAVMVLPIAAAPDTLLADVTLDIRKATTDQHFYDMDQVFYEVWKDDPFTEATPTRMSDWLLPRYQSHPQSLDVYVVYVDERPVSYGRVEYAEGNPFASIWGGSTLADYRRQGIYTQLVAQRLHAAKARDCTYLTVDARQDTSMPILEKLGFVKIAIATAFNWSPAST